MALHANAERRPLFVVPVLLFIFFSPVMSEAQKTLALEKRLTEVARIVDSAVVPLMYWGEHGRHPENAGIVGTGFLINEQGYFVTASHVLAQYEGDSN